MSWSIVSNAADRSSFITESCWLRSTFRLRNSAFSVEWLNDCGTKRIETGLNMARSRRGWSHLAIQSLDHVRSGSYRQVRHYHSRCRYFHIFSGGASYTIISVIWSVLAGLLSQNGYRTKHPQRKPMHLGKNSGQTPKDKSSPIKIIGFVHFRFWLDKLLNSVQDFTVRGFWPGRGGLTGQFGPTLVKT